MTKKLRSFRVMSCIVAGLTTVAFIVACGSGELENIKDDVTVEQAMRLLANENRLSGIVEKPSSIYEEPSSSSEKAPGGESSPSQGASSGKESSSPSSTPSSSSIKSSSSEDVNPGTHDLSCMVTKTEFTTGSRIPDADRPEIKCTEKAKPNTVTILSEDNALIEWSGAPSWGAPQSGTYDKISVTITDVEGDAPKGCKRLKADCKGKIEVTGDAPRPPVTVSSSSRASTTTSSASNTTSSASNSGGPCKDGGNDAYCKWGSECSAIDTRYGYLGETEATQTCGPKASKLCSCADLIQNCKDYSETKTVYHNAQCTSGSTGGGGTSSSSGSNQGGGGSCTTVSKDVDFNSTSGSCYNYTSDTDYDCTIRAYTQTVVELKVTCSNSTTATKTTKASDWTDFLTCPKKTVTKIEANGATKMHMNCW